jgi:DNA-directed RNA polymerase subunit RPC12/RpoP
MAHLIMSAIALIAVILAFSYAYYLLHLMLTITKCPDCGRIMQKVMYTELSEDGEQRQVLYECRFCQSKRIKKSSLPRGRKYTLYP